MNFQFYDSSYYLATPGTPEFTHPFESLTPLKKKDEDVSDSNLYDYVECTPVHSFPTPTELRPNFDAFEFQQEEQAPHLKKLTPKLHCQSSDTVLNIRQPKAIHGWEYQQLSDNPLNIDDVQLFQGIRKKVPPLDLESKEDICLYTTHAYKISVISKKNFKILQELRPTLLFLLNGKEVDRIELDKPKIDPNQADVSYNFKISTQCRPTHLSNNQYALKFIFSSASEQRFQLQSRPFNIVARKKPSKVKKNKRKIEGLLESQPKKSKFD